MAARDIEMANDPSTRAIRAGTISLRLAPVPQSAGEARRALERLDLPPTVLANAQSSYRSS